MAQKLTVFRGSTVSIRSLGDSPQRQGNFLQLFEIQSYFNAIGSYFAHAQNHLKELDFNIETPIEKIKLFNPPFNCNLSPKHVKNLVVEF